MVAVVDAVTMAVAAFAAIATGATIADAVEMSPRTSTPYAASSAETLVFPATDCPGASRRTAHRGEPDTGDDPPEHPSIDCQPHAHKVTTTINIGGGTPDQAERGCRRTTATRD